MFQSLGNETTENLLHISQWHPAVGSLRFCMEIAERLLLQQYLWSRNNCHFLHKYRCEEDKSFSVWDLKQCLFYLSLTLACTGSHWIEKHGQATQILSLFFLEFFSSINCSLSIFSDAAFVKNSMDAFFARHISQSKSENNCPQILRSPLSKVLCMSILPILLLLPDTKTPPSLEVQRTIWNLTDKHAPSAKILILLETQVEWFLLNLKCIYARFTFSNDGKVQQN